MPRTSRLTPMEWTFTSPPPESEEEEVVGCGDPDCIVCNSSPQIVDERASVRGSFTIQPEPIPVDIPSILSVPNNILERGGPRTPQPRAPRPRPRRRPSATISDDRINQSTPLKVYLIKSDCGTGVCLVCDDVQGTQWFIVQVTERGIKRFSGLPPRLGFQVDTNGYILIEDN